MSNVIVQLEGIGAYRVDSELAARMSQAKTQETSGTSTPDMYVTDPLGRVWAPCTDHWILWIPAAH
jgi:hypothetical protein